MKKITFLACFMTLGLTMSATNFYVDAAQTDDSGDGLSWATAKKTITAAYTAATANAGWDNIFVKGGTYDNGSSGWSVASGENIYGSFRGDESTPAERPMIDVDGNGITEPWEFQYPSAITSSYNGTAITLPNSNIVFNGFTITHTASSTTGLVRTISCSSTVATFENNIIVNCQLTAAMPSATIGGVIIKAQGNIKNCLFEKNQVTINAKFDGSVMPVMEALTNTKLTGTIFRNNRVNMDYSGGTSTNANARGLILNIAGGTTTDATTHTTVNNCLVYNNEVSYTGNTTATTLTNGAIVTATAFSASATTDSIINCVIANNKTISCKTAGLNVIKAGTAVHWVLNNILWNNQKDGVVNNLTLGTSLASGLIGNNIMNGGATNLNAGTYISNNLIDLSTNNADNASAPRFTSPSTAIGYSASGSVETAKWTLDFGSYLAKKGISTTRSTDKAGVSFASPRAVGAYEYTVATITPVITWSQDLSLLTTSSTPVTLTASSNADAVLGTAITYVSSDVNVVTVSGNTLTVVGAGTATVTAQQASNNFYNAATNVPQSVTVSQDQATGIENNTVNSLFQIGKNYLVTKSAGNIQILNFSGSQIKHEMVAAWKVISLPSGAYIVRFTSSTGTYTHKILL